MRVNFLLVPVLLYSLTVVAADETVTDEPQRAPERWGDAAPEYGSCDERAQLSGVGAPWVSSQRTDRAREGEPDAVRHTPPDSVPERRPN